MEAVEIHSLSPRQENDSAVVGELNFKETINYNNNKSEHQSRSKKTVSCDRFIT